MPAPFVTARPVASGAAAPTIGVLAVQGDVREHADALLASGAQPVPVRRPGELAGLHGLVIPGGESTVIDKLLRAFELRDPVRAAIADGLPVYGSCAGMILLADEVLDGTVDQQTLGGMAITVRRNAFGRQVDSFETDLQVAGITTPATPMRAVFIRAPWVEHVGAGVQVLATVPTAVGGPAAGRVVAARAGNLLVTSFHPEVTGDARVHEYFVRLVRER
ncbi:5'-phosphate synthase pdxT subunit [Kineosphaera limosa]|uniref:pyridoxal 5'-phosphate synthase glutaminase subunit PdxT n=1 Tax=Kineosphaera limosa TaxID=111564 RepID=UPI000309ACA2|nr:pyridoxal 5'-phosphate synthase glutaminase subunit PdxT [Kineosphaera limosa]NYD98874.1 5'-phosphate synthase pdxT subunit [Kineosphaera limosa]